jgi:NAD-dependent dihydropyrimidine dehydrogenase PreA subunit
MALREIVKIDEEKCDGCGDCVPSCAEGAIQVIDGKARLLSDNLCDGLGACLGECPQGAITVEKREAVDYDEEAVSKHFGQAQQKPAVSAQPLPIAPPHGPGAGGCPGSRMLQFAAPAAGDAAQASAETTSQSPELRQWPIQLHLVPPTAPFFEGADVLLAADCTPFAVPDFHSRYLKGRSLAVACPKLDSGQEIYLQKLVDMIDVAKINTLTVLIMQVPCCAGLVGLAQEAVARASRKIPVKRIVVGFQGEVLADEWC